MKNRQLSKLREDWLAGNSVVAFMGALLFAQSTQLSDAAYQLPFNVAIPSLSDVVVFCLLAFLLVSSIVLALASIIRPIQSWALDQARAFSSLLGLLIWGAFMLSWLEAYSNLRPDLWWSQLFFWVGFGFFLFLGYRFIRTAFQSRYA